LTRISSPLIAADAALDFGRDVDGIYVFGPDTHVLAERNGSPRLATHSFGRGRAVYLSGFQFTGVNTRLLHRALSGGCQRGQVPVWNTATSRPRRPISRSGKLVGDQQRWHGEATVVTLGDGHTTVPVELDAHGIAILNV